MRPSNTIKLKLDDKLFKYVPFKGVFTYLVKEVRSYSDNEQYEIECQDCSDHTKCRLLVCQVDNSKTFQYVAILNDEDEKQYYWHNDQDRYFYQSKKECKLNEGQNLLTNVVNGNLGISPGKSTDARLRINASPKIKFFHGSKFRPWIIPVGLEINILGVPSNAVSVLNSGMQFGTGAEYELFRGIVLGADARYHYATSSIDGTVTNGVSTGGYVGFKF